MMELGFCPAHIYTEMNQTASRERQSGANLGFSLFVKLLVGVNLALAGGILYALSNQSKPSTSSHDDQLDGVAEISSAWSMD